MPFDLTNAMMVLVRAMALLSVMPVLSMTNMPARLRIGLAVAVTVLVAPFLPPLPEPGSLVQLVFMLAKETGIGLLMGFVAKLLFHALEFAGSIVALEMSLSMASVVSPFTGSQNQTPGLILYYLGAVMFLALDMHHWMLMIFSKSYVAAPVGVFHLNSALFEEIIRMTARLFVIGLLMAAPLLAVNFLINLVFAVLGRTVPQMNVFIESFAVRILVGLVVFGSTLTLMAQHISNYLTRLPADLSRVLQLVGMEG